MRVWVAPCERTDPHMAHRHEQGSQSVHCRGVAGRHTADSRDRLLSDLRLLGHMADQDVRRFVSDLLEFCVESELRTPDGDAALPVDRIRGVLRKVADGR
jgi:hypothetical protein